MLENTALYELLLQLNYLSGFLHWPAGRVNQCQYLMGNNLNRWIVTQLIKMTAITTIFSYFVAPWKWVSFALSILFQRRWPLSLLKIKLLGPVCGIVTFLGILWWDFSIYCREVLQCVTHILWVWSVAIFFRLSVWNPGRETVWINTYISCWLSVLVIFQLLQPSLSLLRIWFYFIVLSLRVYLPEVVLLSDKHLPIPRKGDQTLPVAFH